MSEHRETRFVIEQARETGYFVTAAPIREGYPSPVICAGTLSDCLGFLEGKLTPAPVSTGCSCRPA